MNDELSLFGDDVPNDLPTEPPRPTPIADWQIDQLRRALDARDLKSMDERKAAIVTAVGREVESLRNLTHEEGLRALTNLGPSTKTSTDTKSAWDERDEPTWIDNL